MPSSRTSEGRWACGNLDTQYAGCSSIYTQSPPKISSKVAYFNLKADSFTDQKEVTLFRATFCCFFTSLYTCWAAKSAACWIKTSPKEQKRTKNIGRCVFVYLKEPTWSSGAYTDLACVYRLLLSSCDHWLFTAKLYGPVFSRSVVLLALESVQFLPRKNSN